MAHTRAHLWRAMLEAVVLGTRAAIEALSKSGLGASEIKIAGGATRSPFWLQMHADATGLPVLVTEFDNAPLLGAALLAAVGAGLFNQDSTSTSADDRETLNNLYEDKYDAIRRNVKRGIQSMVKVSRRIEPNPESVEKYRVVYKKYKFAVDQVADISHLLATRNEEVKPSDVIQLTSTSTIIMPSLLAADFGHLADEAQNCVAVGAEWVHIDVCDGGSLCGGSLTIGPGTIGAIRRACPSLGIGW